MKSRFFLISLNLVLPLWSADTNEFRYFPATLENTTLVDGTPLKFVSSAPSAPEEMTRGTAPAQPTQHWHWRENKGSGAGTDRGLFAAAGNHGNDAPMLLTTIAGLKPKTDYQVYGCFWIAGYTSDKATPSGNSLWDIRLGCGLSEMMGYGYKTNTGFPVTIQSGDERPWGDGLRDKEEDRRMLSANLGTVRTDAKGSLIVYVDDQPGDIHQARTWYDGIGVLPAKEKARIGAGAPGALHRAVRCADWEMVRRELEAGADINALDRDGLTPLFYNCVDPDLKRIESLLKAGARPDVEGQALSPLWAAATAGRADLAALLLKSGAKIPLDPPSEDYNRKKLKINGRAHPAVAAIHSGSTPVLKLLLDKEPELDLDLLYSIDYEPKLIKKIGQPFAVMDAVVASHPEMAEYLISLGCQIEINKNGGDSSKSKKLSDNFPGSRQLLVAAAMAGSPMHGVVSALARRGVKLVDKDVTEYAFLVPWDALSAAAFAGDAVMVRQLLPEADGASMLYQWNITTLAEAGGNREVVNMVKNRFSDMIMPKWQEHGADASEATEQRITDDARVFKLRNVPFTPQTHSRGEKVLAVISDPGSAGPAAALTAKASAVEGWICVEREQIDSLLRESRLAKPWDDAAQDMSRIGDKLAADLLIIVSKLESKDLNLLRLEAVDVRSGLPIDRLHIDEKSFKPNEFCDKYLADIRNKLEERLSGKELIAVTLLPITVDENLPGSNFLEGMLHGGLLQQIDQTPDTIALTRDQMQPLAEEKILGKSGDLLGAAWTIEGGLHSLEGNQVELALRVRSLGKNGEAHDVKATGNTGDIQSLVRDAWAKIPAIIKPDANSVKTPNDGQRAGNEAARLLRESEWLHHIGRNHDAAALVDSALYLGADSLQTNMLRMRIHMAKRKFRPFAGHAYAYPNPVYFSSSMPMSPRWVDKAAQHLPEFLELLRINSECFERIEKLIPEATVKSTSGGPMNDFLSNIYTLVFYRSVLLPGLMTEENTVLLKEFDGEFESHIKRIFDMITPSNQECTLLLHFKYINNAQLRAVPALADSLAEAVVRIFDCSDFQLHFIGDFADFFRVYGWKWTTGYVPGRSSMLCDALEKAVIKSNSPFKNLRMAEIKFLRSCGEQRTVAARELLEVRIATLSTVRKPIVDWVHAYDLACWSPMPTSDTDFYPAFDLRHGDSLIPSLLYTPGITPDRIFRQSQYSDIAASLYVVRKNSVSGYSSARLADHLELRMNRMVEGNEPAGEFDGLLASAHLIDRMLGVDVAKSLEPKVLRIRPKENRKGFGSHNQFPFVEYEGAVKGRILVDLCSGITNKPAMWIDQVVDPKNRHILWGVLQPYEERDFKLNQPNMPDGSIPLFSCGHPWLLAVDCRNGSVVHKINLDTACGYTKATSQRVQFGNIINQGLFFNDTHILVQITWMPDEDRKAVCSTLLVNRTTGSVEKIEEPLNFYELMMPDYGQPYNPVVGLGDSFYIVQIIDNRGTLLWRVKPGTKPELLAKSGRRPEKTPFDAQDRAICYVNKDGGKLIAASSWNYFGRFDPQSGNWTTDPERTDAQGKGFVENLERRDYHATIFPHHLFKREDGKTDAFGAPDCSKPGQLEFQKLNRPISYLPVDLRIPDSYVGRFQVLSKPLGTNETLPISSDQLEYEWVNVADYARSLSMRPGILNQTESHFVLGAHVYPGRSHHIIGSGTYLPFLWAIDKAEMSEGMQRASEKQK